jgi:hypothetical protein
MNYPKILQKSYKTEKRLMTPFPVVFLVGRGWRLSAENSLASALASSSSSSASSSSGTGTRSEPGEREDTHDMPLSISISLCEHWKVEEIGRDGQKEKSKERVVEGEGVDVGVGGGVEGESERVLKRKWAGEHESGVDKEKEEESEGVKIQGSEEETGEGDKEKEKEESDHEEGELVVEEEEDEVLREGTEKKDVAELEVAKGTPTKSNKILLPEGEMMTIEMGDISWIQSLKVLLKSGNDSETLAQIQNLPVMKCSFKNLFVDEWQKKAFSLFVRVCLCSFL